GTGLSNPYPGARDWLTDWQRIDVSAGGNLITSQCAAGIATWSVSGTTATNAACCWAYACSTGSSPIPDVADHATASFGVGMIGFGKVHSGCSPEEDWSLGFKDTDLPNYSGYNFSGNNDYPATDFLTNLVGLEGVDGTNNIMIFYSSATDGKISIWGDAYSQSGTATEIDFTGAVGTGPSEFTGGLDFSIDSAGNIVTVENDGGGVFRFQKFASDFTFIYEYVWDGVDTPMRVDFDKGDDTLYMLTSDGVHTLMVN
ncbi:hypothetical protein KKB99_05200, partial [bacterium]|nr:hypothetical protein [bacterium]MBU1025393.1 hypothetical protein [bacterium]